MLDSLQANPKHIRAMKDGKAPLEYLITSVDDGDAWVLKGGGDKYGICNWLIDKILATTYVGAIKRHLKAWTEGQDIDPESGYHHFHHIRACCAIVLDAEKNGMLIDDRDRAESIDQSQNSAEMTAPVTNTERELRYTCDHSDLDRESYLFPGCDECGWPEKPAAPLYTVTYTYTQPNMDMMMMPTSTKTFGPFDGRRAAELFVKSTQGQMPGKVSFSTLIPVQENENVGNRSEETKRLDSGADRRAEDSKVALQRARQHSSDSPIRSGGGFEPGGSRSK